MTIAQLGEMRDIVVLCNMVQATDPNTKAIVEELSGDRLVAAAIMPVSTYMWLAGRQLDYKQITHRVTIQWTGDIGTFTWIKRQRLRPDGSLQTEIYQVQRIIEDGQQIVSMLDVTFIRNE